MANQIRPDREIQAKWNNNEINIGEDSKNREIAQMRSEELSFSSIESAISSLETNADNPRSLAKASTKAFGLVLSTIVKQTKINEGVSDLNSKIQSATNTLSTEQSNINGELTKLNEKNKKLEDSIQNLEKDRLKLAEKLDELESSGSVLPKTVLAVGAVAIGVIQTIQN